MGRFKVKAGIHVEGKKTIYKKGAIVDSALDLCKKFPEKFELMENIPANEAKAAAPKVDEVKKEEKPKDENKKADGTKKDEKPSPYGENVTALFKEAEDNGLQVFKKKNWLTVVDGEDGKVLNEKGLRAEGVDAFITKHFEGE